MGRRQVSTTECLALALSLHRLREQIYEPLYRMGRKPIRKE